jgi:hypothetical protein
MTKIAEVYKSHIFRRLNAKTRRPKAQVSVALVRIQTELFDTALSRAASPEAAL